MLLTSERTFAYGHPVDVQVFPQRSFEDLGTPLAAVRFCVLDLETTGPTVADCAITEIGATKVQGGACAGTLQTFVNPGRAIPPSITMLTGITQAMVMPAPRIEAVLATVLEFIGDAVIVGHNVRFDLAFLNAALLRDGRPRLANAWVDTCAVARRLLGDEVPNCRLGTLASRLRLAHQPTHRALDDALATTDLLHLLLERAAGLGVLGLDDLLALPTIGGHPQAGKLRLTTGLPRTPGVYIFRDHGGRPLYVGKATNLRARVRSYFGGDDRRKVGPLLRETHTIDHIPCGTALEAAVVEVRLIHELLPRYNRRSTGWRSYVYVKLTAERFPRLAVTRTASADGADYIGPVPSRRAAAAIVDAIHTATPLRRCQERIRRGPPTRGAPCAAAQLGVAACPCAGTITEAAYEEIVVRVRRGLTSEPDLLLGPLRQRMDGLAALERFEEAADVRDRAGALAGALRRQRRVEGVRDSGRMVVDLPGQGGAELDGGVLVRAWAGPPPLAVDDCPGGQLALPLASRSALPVTADLADELACVVGWLDANAGRVRLVHCDGGLRSALPRLPSFEPIERSTDGHLRR
jgi:DNA polymerase-3 subunit epsilon